MINLEYISQVWGVVGNLGGGKSLTGVQIAVSSLIKGWFVISNIRLDIDAIASLYGNNVRSLYMFVDFATSDFWNWPCGDPRGSGGSRRVVIVLDEMADYLDQYSSTSRLAKEFMAFLRQSSKRSQDVILIAQRQEYLAKSLRSLVHRWIWVDDLRVFRLPVLKIRIPFMSSFVVQRAFDRYGNIVQRASFISKKEWGRFFDTAQLISGVHSYNGSVYQIPSDDLHSSSFLPFFLWILSLFFL